jgi:HAD superfamily hydrolase (TIGR01450 family)
MLPEVSIEELIDRYAMLLLDAYGVLVHASGPLPGARELLDELNRIGKSYYVLTNEASRLPETAAQRYRGFGLPIGPERIITAGSLLAGYFSKHDPVGNRCVVLGTKDSARYVEQAGGIVVPPGEPFDALVIADEAGFPFLETVDAVLTGLFRKIDRGEEVQLVLPNPDLVYPKGDQGFGIASGSVALMFEAALQLRYPDRQDLRFARLGKPHTAIFAEARRRSGTDDMVMIGDQLETDIRGANAFGIDSALVAGGVWGSGHALPTDGPRPTYLLASVMPVRGHT